MEAFARESDPHAGGDVREGFAIQIAKHCVRLFCIVAEIIHITIGRIKILPPVIVIVDEAGAPTAEPKGKAPETGGEADVPEELVAIAGEKGEYLCREIVIKEVYETVVIKVLRVGSHAVDGNPIVIEGNAVNGSLFVELAATLVDEQKIPLRVIDDEDVRQSIIIDVGNRHTHPFAMCLTKPGLFGDIL